MTDSPPAEFDFEVFKRALVGKDVSLWASLCADGCKLQDRRRIIEHVIIHYQDGKIDRQVEVESWA